MYVLLDNTYHRISSYVVSKQIVYMTATHLEFPFTCEHSFVKHVIRVILA